MKKYVNKLKRIVAVILSMALVISLFQSDMLRTFADENATTPVKNFVTDEGQIVSDNYYPTTADEPLATIKSDTIIVYDYHKDGAKLLELTGVKDTEIYLSQKIVYENGTVLYRYYASENEGTVYEVQLKGYFFILATDVIINGETTEKTLTDETGIAVKGELPADVTLTVEAIATEELGINTTTYGIGDNGLFFDVTLFNGDEDYQPENGVTVEFPEDKIPFATGATYYAYHIHDDGTVDKIGPYVYDGGSISVDFSGLSYVGLAEDEVLLERVPQNEEPELIDIENTTAKINVTPLEVYGDIAYGEYGVVVEGMVGTEIVLRQSATYSDGTVMYRYDYNYTTADALAEVAIDYPFIHEDDIVIIEEEEEIFENLNLLDEATGISVSGYLPQGTTLKVKAADVKDTGLDATKHPLGANTTVFDISLWKDDKEYHPDDEVSLCLPEEYIYFNLISGYVLYHIQDDGTIDTYGPYVYTDGDINLSIESFSYFVYTDAFPEANSINWTRYINKNTVTLYDSPLPGANEYIYEEAFNVAIKAKKYFIDTNGTKWFRFTNSSFTDFDTNYIYIKAEDLSESEIVDRNVTDEITGINVSGEIPSEITIEVKQVTDITGLLDTSRYPISDNTVVYDITLKNGDAVYQPESAVEVTFPASLFEGVEEDTIYIGYHIHDGIVDRLGPYQYTGEDIIVTVESFSVIVLTETVNAETLPTPTTSSMVYFENGEEYNATFADDEVVLYADFSGLVDTATVTNAAGDKISIVAYVDYEDGTRMYFYYYEDTNAEIGDLRNNGYMFISSADVSFDNTVLTDADTGISVQGNIPRNAKLIVNPINKENISLGTNYPLGNNTVAYDITLTLNGQLYQPEDDVTIVMPEKNLNFGLMSAYVMYHTHGTETEVIGPIVYTGGDVHMSVSGFSQFVYTDAFAEANNIRWTMALNKDTVTLYEKPLPNAISYEASDVKGYMFFAKSYYVDTNGQKWYAFTNDKFTDFATERVYVKAEDTVFYPSGKNYTQVAPFTLKNPEEMQQTMTYAALRNNSIMSLADENGDSSESSGYVRTDNPGIISSKDVSYIDNKYWITLENYVTGSTTTSTEYKELPTDIILVLDQSGSMADSMTKIEYELASGTANQVYLNSEYYNQKLYAKVGTEYKEVTITGGGTKSTESVYIPWSEDDEYTVEGNMVWPVEGPNSFFYDDERRNNIYYYAEGEYREVTVTRTQQQNQGGMGGYPGGTQYVYTYTYVDSNGDTKAIQHTNRWDGQQSDTIRGENEAPSFANELYMKVDGETWSNYTFKHISADGNEVTAIFAANDQITANTYYYKKTSQITRLEALKTAVQTFVDSVETKAKGKDGTIDEAGETDPDDISHRIAIVGFASDDNSNTEIITVDGTNNTVPDTNPAVQLGVRYSQLGDTHYSTALQDMTTSSGVTMVENAVKVLASNGATQVDYGIAMANSIWEAAEQASADNAETEGYKYHYTDPTDSTKVLRNKVVIVFTDGSPTSSSGFGKNVAENAIQNANTTKKTVAEGGHGALIYTVGIFDGANAENPASLPAYNTTNSNRENRFMHLVSSNYPNATGIDTEETGTVNSELKAGDSYYLSASDSETLNNIFQKISSQIQSGGSSITLGSTTVIQDVLSPYFKLPSGVKVSDIIIETHRREKDSDGQFVWINENQSYTDAETSQKPNISTIDEVTGTVKVTGFNFSKNYVADSSSSVGRQDAEHPTVSGNFYGRKLIIKFEIQPKDGFLGGNGVPTNDAENSGLYIPKDDGTITWEENFEEPSANVAINDVIGLVVPDKNVYLGNSVVASDLMVGVTATSNGTTIYPTTDLGWKDDFVTITPTLPADATNLTSDTTYSVTVTITPTGIVDNTLPGVVATTQAQIESGTINVYKPEITVVDKNVYYGGIAPTAESFNEHVTKTDWKHGETLSTAVTMVGTAPELTVSGAYVTLSDVNNGVIFTAEDILVDLTAKIGTTDITTYTNVIHDSCGDKTALTTKQLKLHVFVPTYTFADAGVHLGATVPTEASVLAGTTTGGTWVSATGISADNYANAVPDLELNYKTAKTGVIETTDDIGVNVEIKAGAIDATNVAQITKGTHVEKDDDFTFVLHVYKPELTFKDSYEIFGNAPSKAVTDYYDTVNKVNDVVWKPATYSVTMFTEAPTLTLKYTPNTDPWVKNNIVAAEADFYVNVMVEAGNTDITNYTAFVHQNIDDLPDTHTECLYTFKPDKGEFIVHIDILETDLTITKTVIAKDYDKEATFVFEVTGINKDCEDFNITVVIPGSKMEKDTEGNYSAKVVINAMRPKTSVTVTEDTSWSWRYKVDDVATKVITSLNPEKGKNQIQFKNAIESNKWLSSEAYVENIFADSNGQGSNAKNSAETN